MSLFLSLVPPQVLSLLVVSSIANSAASSALQKTSYLCAAPVRHRDFLKWNNTEPVLQIRRAGVQHNASSVSGHFEVSVTQSPLQDSILQKEAAEAGSFFA
jgi:hypothetical protein